MLVVAWARAMVMVVVMLVLLVPWASAQMYFVSLAHMYFVSLLQQRFGSLAQLQASEPP